MVNEMIELGKVQKLTVIREKKFGIYLGEKGSAEGVLLPAKQVPEGTVLGDELEVFIYRDSGDRLIATTRPVSYTHLPDPGADDVRRNAG